MEINYYKIYWTEDESPSFTGCTCKTLKEIINFHLLISEYFNKDTVETCCSDYCLGIIKTKYVNFYNYMNKNKNSMKYDLLETKIMFKDEILDKIKANIIKITNENPESKEYRRVYHDDYRIKNKKKIYEARKIWVQKNREAINCPCGGVYDNHLNEKKKRHMMSKRHLEYIKCNQKVIENNFLSDQLIDTNTV